MAKYQYTPGSSEVVNTETGIGQSYRSADQAATAFKNLQAGEDQMATNPVTTTPAPEAKPIGILSTDNAEATVTKKVNKLNQMAPVTTDSSSDTSNSNTDAKTATPAPAPKAYFTNAVGQEAEFTDDQLKDPTTQKFLQDNNYIQTRTEGPTLNVSGNLQNDVKTYDDAINGLVTKFLSYNVDSDPGFVSYSSAIKNSYTQLKQSIQESAQLRAELTRKSINTFGARTGLSRYSPMSFNNFRADSAQAVLDKADSKVQDLVAKEAEAVATARKSYEDGNISQFNAQMNALEKIRDDKAKALTDYNGAVSDLSKEIRTQNTKAKEAIRQASRDTAIGGLLAQGVDDPNKMLEYLNYDDQGNQVGDFTAKEVGDTLKSLAPQDDMNKLSSAVRDFYILQKQGKLPSSVASLPEDQQLFSWLRQQKEVTHITQDTDRKLSINDVNSLNSHGLELPISVVGMSQNDILDSLYEDKVPNWFEEKLIAEQGNDDYAQTRWDEYRQNALANFESGAGGP